MQEQLDDQLRDLPVFVALRSAGGSPFSRALMRDIGSEERCHGKAVSVYILIVERGRGPSGAESLHNRKLQGEVNRKAS